MKKSKQLLYFLALLALILALRPVEILSMAQAGTYVQILPETEAAQPKEFLSEETPAKGIILKMTVPEDTDLEGSIPEETALEEATLKETISEEATLEETILIEATPEETSPEDTPPIETTPIETTPEETQQTETQVVPPDPSDNPSKTESSASVSMPSDIIQEPAMAPVRIATRSNTEPREIVKVMTPYSDILILAERQNARELLETKLENREFSTAAVLFSDKTRELYPIRYDLDALDMAQTGLISLNGTVEVPDDVSMDPELTAVTLPVFLYDPKAPCELPVRSSDPVHDSQLLLAQNSSFEDLQKALKDNRSTYLYLDDSIVLEVLLTWDVSSVIFGTPGTYRIHGIPELPEGIILSGELSSFPCDIIIQETGGFSLTPPIYDGISFFTRWTKPTPQLEKFHRYYAVGDNGAWQEDTTGKFMLIASHNTQLMSVFYYEDFLFDVPYYFQLEYDGECSNILKVCLNEGDLHYDLIEGDRDGGDRGEQTPPTVTLPPDQPDDTPPLGTTRPEGTIPPETRPEETLPEEADPEKTYPAGQEDTSRNGSSSGASLSPLPEAEPSVKTPEEQAAEPSGAAAIASAASPSPTEATETAATTAAMSAPAPTGQEADTADYTILSGRRIHKELELNPGRPVVITKHRIRLEIPDDTGLFSSMSEQSLFRAEVMSLADNQISVVLSMDGVPLAALPSMTITMPWKADGEKPVLEVTNEHGKVLGTAAYLDSSTITYQLSENGIFTIETQKAASAPAAVTPPAPVVPTDGQTGDSVSSGSSSVALVVCILLAGILTSGFFILRFHRRGRRKQP